MNKETPKPNQDKKEAKSISEALTNQNTYLKLGNTKICFIDPDEL